MRQRFSPRPVSLSGEPFETAEAAWFWLCRCRELPVLAGLFLLIWRTRHEVFRGLERQHREAEGAHEQLREQLSAYKLEVAQTYASIPALKEAERRLTEHLVRIEMKLDGVAVRRGGGRT
ncbi:MAG: hypothetical protein R3316_02990 [Rhodovibrionaceae bacterium]|nr:hypothetical protein [Rhodovibrionaceae bacterium]